MIDAEDQFADAFADAVDRGDGTRESLVSIRRLALDVLLGCRLVVTSRRTGPCWRSTWIESCPSWEFSGQSLSAEDV